MAIHEITARNAPQWMLALATTHDGDVPIFLRPLDGNSSDKEQLSAAVKAVLMQLREQVPDEQEQRIAVFDSGGYSQANMKSYNDAHICWISRVPETSTVAKAALEEVDEQWQPLSDGSGEYVVRLMELPQGKENLPGVGKTPLASLHSSLCLPKRCAAGLETGDERETSLADGYVHRQRTGAVSATRPPEKRGHAGSNGLVSGSQPGGRPARGDRPGEKESSLHCGHQHSGRATPCSRARHLDL